MAVIFATFMLSTSLTNLALGPFAAEATVIAVAMLLGVLSATAAVLAKDRAPTGWHIANLTLLAATFGATLTLPITLPADMITAVGDAYVWMLFGAAFVIGGITARLSYPRKSGA